MVVARQTLPVGEFPVLSGTHFPEQHSACHLHVTRPSRHVGAAVGTEVGDVGSVVGAHVSLQLFPVLDAESGRQIPLQHDDIHRHSSPPTRHGRVGDDSVLGSASTSVSSSSVVDSGSAVVESSSVVGSCVGGDGTAAGVGDMDSAVGDHVPLQLLPVLDASSGRQMPLQHDDIHLHSSFSCRHDGVGAVDSCVVGCSTVASLIVVGAAVGGTWQLLPVADVTSCKHLPEQHEADHTHSMPS